MYRAMDDDLLAARRPRRRWRRWRGGDGLLCGAGPGLELLHQRGRVSYRALKRQFHLDDEILEDLKEELIEAHSSRWTRTDDVLVWTGKRQHRRTVASPQRHRRTRLSARRPPIAVAPEPRTA